MEGARTVRLARLLNIVRAGGAIAALVTHSQCLDERGERA